MATQTSLMAQQVRIRQWAEQIHDCQNRPKGMDVETWCLQNNLTKSNYYYRLRRVRKACLNQIPVKGAPAFVELQAPASKKPVVCEQAIACNPAGAMPLIRIQNTKGLSAEIFSDVSLEMISQLIEAFSHAE